MLLAEHTLTLLKDAHESDPSAMHALLCNAVPCAKRYLKSFIPQIIMPNRKGYMLSSLCVINGILEKVTGYGIKLSLSIANPYGFSEIQDFSLYSIGKTPALLSNTEVMTISTKLLNDLIKIDPDAIHALVCNRVACNKNLITHPSIQVYTNPVISDKSCTLGLLGLLNGILEPITHNRIAVEFSDPLPEGYCKMVGFLEYVPNPEFETA